MKGIILYIMVLCFSPLSLLSQKIVALKIDGTINPATVEYVQRGISRANDANAECLIIHLNTPGGLLKSTRIIVSEILESPVPVVVYVSPGGAHAGSAGVFITLAAHIAVMAPGTNIGAAHPVSTMEQLDTVMNEKVTNDAVAFISTIAQKRHRNVEWAAEAVRHSVSITEEEALKKNVIDFIAPGEKAIADSINGKKVELPQGPIILHTSKAEVELVEMGWFEKVLNVISDPNITYILFLIGIYGLLFEIYNPGVFFPGIAGAVSLILALYSMHTLPVNYAGVALLILALILFILELKLISHGVLAIGGIISMILGSLMLIRTDKEWEIESISWGIIIPAVAATVVFFFVVIGMGLKAQRLKPVTGSDAMAGKTGRSISELNPNGTVIVEGEIWNAVSSSGNNIDKDKNIRVLQLKDFTLIVETTEI